MRLLQGLEDLLGGLDRAVDVLLGVGQAHEASLVLGGGKVHATLEHATVPLGELGLYIETQRQYTRQPG